MKLVFFQVGHMKFASERLAFLLAAALISVPSSTMAAPGSVPVTLANLAPPALTTATAAVPGAAAAPTGRQEPLALRQAVEQFLQRQSAGLPGEVSIEVGTIDPRLNLQACLQPEPFLAHGSRVWGRTAVGVRCSVPAPWTIYLSATVHVTADYATAAAPLAQNQRINAGDVAMARGDLTMLPAGVITDLALALDHTTMSSVPAGAPLRRDTLRALPAVQMGQTIRLVSSGAGFQISTEGRAMNNAVAGQTVQARTLNGQLVSGIARAGGILDVAY